MRYRPTDGNWYWIGCVDFKNTYIYTASDPTGDWSLTSTIDTCYYDCGLLFDGEDIYVAYGNTNISVAQLNQDLTQKQTQTVYNGSFYIEGSRLYKIDDTYYILVNPVTPCIVEMLADLYARTLNPPTLSGLSRAPATCLDRMSRRYS